jgi:hypothetical protein
MMSKYKDEMKTVYSSLDDRKLRHISVPMTFLILSKAY